MEDDSPHARLIQEARERAIRGWSQNGYTVHFTPTNLFALRKVESLRLPDGMECSLRTFGVERAQSLQ